MTPACPAMPHRRCLHCTRWLSRSVRGLCSTCYNDLSVRVRYGAAQRNGLCLANSPLPLAPGPTDAAPGSAEKVEVMIWRVANGFAAMHPGDPVLGKRHPADHEL